MKFAMSKLKLELQTRAGRNFTVLLPLFDARHEFRILKFRKNLEMLWGPMKLNLCGTWACAT